MASSSGTEYVDDMASQLQQNLESEVVQEILRTGTDLRQYSRQIEKELKEVENKSIQDYIKESQNIASLHNQIAACDNILERMEVMLLGFQSHLGSINSEMVQLQKRSASMSQQLSNRQAVRATLSQFVDDMTVSEALISCILESPVTDPEFATRLTELGHKMSFVKEQSFRETRSVADVKDALEHLRVKAVTKVRAFLLEQVFRLRKPMANYQVPQNNMLAKYKSFFEFLLGNERSVAQEVCGEYVETMGKVYYSYFKAYISRLMKLQYDDCASKDDLMGVDDTASRGLFHSRTNLKNKGAVFSLGGRSEILTTQLKAPIIVPHAASKAEIKYPYEALFRSLQYALVENACREFLFLREFFLVENHPALDLFGQVLGMTLGMLAKNLDNYVSDTYDAIGLLLCVHVTMKYHQLCKERSVPALDQYWDSLQTSIWPRFEYILRLHIQSVKEYDTNRFNKEMRPHYITRRYAEFSAALVSLNEQHPSETVSRLLAQLTEEVECLLLRMAALFTQRCEQLVFLINNLDLILSIHAEHAREDSRETAGIRDHLNQRSAEYVEEVLRPHFGAIMQFVKEGEAMVSRGRADELKKQEGKCMSMAQQFSACWRGALEKLSQEVLSSFPSLVTGSQLLQLALSTLVAYHHRLHALLPAAAQAALTNKHHLMVEIKKDLHASEQRAMH